jgi:hypothetical protein
LTHEGARQRSRFAPTSLPRPPPWFRGKEERLYLDARLKEAIREVVVFELNPEDTPQTARLHKADNNERQESELKKSPAMIWKLIQIKPLPALTNRLFSETVKPFPVSQHQIPCSANINSLFSSKAFPASHLGNFSASFWI